MIGSRRETAVERQFTFAFVGPLIARTVVEKVGLPNKDFFIWFDDHEYALRIQTRRMRRSSSSPTPFSSTTSAEKKGKSASSAGAAARVQPAWKGYYGVRNHPTPSQNRHHPQETRSIFSRRSDIGRE
jgi:hypothetical protein